MNLDQAVAQLDAAAEPSRLRLLVALLGGETSVGDLVTVLGQSQPRVSRHLRLLSEAGLVESFREGRSIFYRWSEDGQDAGVVRSIAAVAAGGDATIGQDTARLQKLSRQRERDALRRALRSGRAGSLHGASGDSSLRDLLGATLGLALGGEPRRHPRASWPLGRALVVGCGSGEVLRLLLPEARLAVGTEPSAQRRQLARARLRQAGSARWTVRAADAGQLPFATAGFDLVVVQDALATAREPERRAVLGEAARVLDPAGRLLILDRILPTDNELATRLAALGLVVTSRQWLPGRTPDRALFLASREAGARARTGTDD
ncbi:MAG: metalloregulator ArsR/SmtB family transcription factor [Gammaproteobacteria bacterium]